MQGNYEQLKASIAAVIKTNGANEITGAIMQQVLQGMVSQIGAGATFAGIATPATNPGSPDQNVYYLAGEAGVYTNFGGYQLEAGKVAIFCNSTGVWVGESIDIVGDALNTLTLANGQDGLIYISLNGVLLGYGFNPQTGRVEEPEVWAEIVTNVGSVTIPYGQTAQIGVKLSVQPTQSQTVTLNASSLDVSLSSNTLTFSVSNWDTYQYVTITNNVSNVGDVDVNLTLTNSDPLLTETSVFVLAKGVTYEDLVDTTIPSGAHTVTTADFETATSGTRLNLNKYIGEYTNIYIPATINIGGTDYTVTLAGTKTFVNNTTIQYVEIANGVKANEYGNTTTARDWTGLFNNCTSLVGVKYNGNDITALGGTFKGCSSLKFFDGLERQTTVGAMNSCFEGAAAIDYIQDLSNLVGLTNLQLTFKSCTSLKKILGFPHTLTGSNVSASSMYYGCTSLTEAIIPKGVNDIFYTCSGATSLRTVNVYQEGTFSRTTGVFNGCTNLKVYCVADSEAYTQLHTAFSGSTTVTVLTFGGSALPVIAVWGDSTSSPNTGWVEWPARLQTQIGASLEVKNQAVSGEYTTSTSARQGGNAMTVGAFTIPATTDAVQITLTSTDNQVFSTNPVFSAGGAFNPCTISGVQGSISQNGGSYYFKRLAAGSAVSVTAGTAVTSDQDGQFNNSTATMLVLLGCNSGWNTDASVLLNQVNLMVQHFVAAGGTQYIVAGAFSGKFMRTQGERDEVFEFETLAAAQFGSHWLNLRQYLIANGLTDNNLTATTSDTERMALGQVPGSLLGGGTPSNILMYPSTSSDDTHPNAYGANSIMLAFFNKGVDLGYWEDEE